MNKKYIVWMEEVGIDDVARVGGKNASLGEMIRNLTAKGIRVPSGFITTADAYRYFLDSTGLTAQIAQALKGLDTSNLKDLARRGKAVRTMILRARMPDDLATDIAGAYAEMEQRYGKNIDVAVRSSATAEDLPGASFAGEHETYLGIRGVRDVTTGIQSAMASLFTDRAISYRVDKGFAHEQIALSVGIQQMVRSDLGASGVMFSIDTESGFKDVVVINAVWGLGEMIVQGHVTPDEYLVFKPMLGKAQSAIIEKKLADKSKKMIYAKGGGAGVKKTKVVSTSARDRLSFVMSDAEVATLAGWAVEIEQHYSEKRGRWTPMDMEWARDGKTGELFIVQARPETVQAERDFTKVTEYVRTENSKELVRGISVGSKVAVGKVRVILNPKDISKFQKGEVLVTTMTDPDWEPIMKIASAIVTDKGGRTSHAAIVSRELGIPAIVGCGNATRALKTGTDVTIDTTGSEGIVLAGRLKFKMMSHDMKALPSPKTKVMVNIATPDIAFERSFLPVMGVGLAREEFIIASHIGIHPMALLQFSKLSPKIKKEIEHRTAGWHDKTAFYVDNLAYGIAKIGAAFYPRPVIVRFSDFKTNEYRTLLGGEAFEPVEENPMIGWRGASRYYDPKFKEAFMLECHAIKKVRDEMGLTNVIPMVPFCRTIEEGKQTLQIMASVGLVAKSLAPDKADAVPVYVMCEIPSNVLLADQFLDLFDGMSIGSNDLTQLALGLDRDSGIVSHISNENDPTVRELIAQAIKVCRRRGKYIGICGQGPSDLPDFALFLIEQGIESISLNPDTVVKTIISIAEKEKTLG
ncbi:MAG: phosphoenolpyruvate synthase [Patescibacteria group bacterium]